MGILVRCALLAALVALLPAPAAAYIDPGTGSMMVQILIGAVAGLAVTGRLYWDRIKRFFVRDPADKGEPPADRDPR